MCVEMSTSLCLRTLVLLLIVVIFNTCNFVSEGREWGDITSTSSKKEGKGSKHHHHGHSSKPKPKPKHKPHPPKPSPKPSPKPHPPKPSPSPGPKPSPAPDKTTFNVLDYGAKGDGVADDTKAFKAAWAAACKIEGSTVVVPSENKFLVGPISFGESKCQPNIVVQFDGMIIAPTSNKGWRSGLLQWIEFRELKGITVRGSGIIDGRGSSWWSTAIDLNDDYPPDAELAGKTRPTALRFYGSKNVTVTGITIQNSPKAHLKMDNCEDVNVYDFTVSSPGDSPNTDAIHLQNSKSVSIHHCQLACGDDCVSIQTGCSNIYIHDVNCGPGHGISIGGLGKDRTAAFVSDVTVRDVVLTDTTNGVRIKSWQGASGSARQIRFSNIKVSGVRIPIVIDQYYCDTNGGKCKNQSSAVALSDISYQNVAGTYTVQPVYLACSDSKPCLDINLSDIQLEPQQNNSKVMGPFCWKAYGQLHDPIKPPIDCLKNGKAASGRLKFDENLH